LSTIHWIQNLWSFPFRIRQETADWCIPANVEAVTKYHKPDSRVTQGYLVTQFGDMTQIGFESIKDRVLKVDPHFSWANIPTYMRDSDFNQSFDKFVGFVEKCVDESNPPMISVPVGETFWHIVTPVGYGPTYLLVYNPDPRIIFPYYPIAKATVRTDLCARKKLKDAATDSLVLSPKKLCAPHVPTHKEKDGPKDLTEPPKDD